MFYYLFLLTSIHFILSYNVPSCTKCKWFKFPSNGLNPELGLCKMFKETYYDKEKETEIYNFAIHCRNNENLCGKSGLLYEENELKKDNETKELNNEYEVLKNRCCGEVNETDEIEQLEREFLEIFQRIKKHNKKRIYDTTKKIYKLFKKDD